MSKVQTYLAASKISTPYNLPSVVRTLYAKFDTDPPPGLSVHNEHTDGHNFIYIDVSTFFNFVIDNHKDHPISKLQFKIMLYCITYVVLY